LLKSKGVTAEVLYLTVDVSYVNTMYYLIIITQKYIKIKRAYMM